MASQIQELYKKYSLKMLYALFLGREVLNVGGLKILEKINTTLLLNY